MIFSRFVTNITRRNGGHAATSRKITLISSSLRFLKNTNWDYDAFHWLQKRESRYHLAVRIVERLKVFCRLLPRVIAFKGYADAASNAGKTTTYVEIDLAQKENFLYIYLSIKMYIHINNACQSRLYGLANIMLNNCTLNEKSSMLCSMMPVYLHRSRWRGQTQAGSKLEDRRMLQCWIYWEVCVYPLLELYVTKEI